MLFLQEMHVCPAKQVENLNKKTFFGCFCTICLFFCYMNGTDSTIATESSQKLSDKNSKN